MRIAYVGIFFAVALCSTAIALHAAEPVKPRIYIEAQEGFETYLAAALAKKNVPVDVAHELRSHSCARNSWGTCVTKRQQVSVPVLDA
jgi:hypothetical protein